MAKLVPPTIGLRGVDIKSERRKYTYNAARGDLYEVSDPRHIAALKSQGFTEAAVYNGANGQGFVCSQCGFNGWFRKCGKCGHEEPPKED